MVYVALVIVLILAVLTGTVWGLLDQRQALLSRIKELQKKLEPFTVVTARTLATRTVRGKTFIVELKPPFLTQLNRVVVISPHGKRHEIRFSKKR